MGQDKFFEGVGVMIFPFFLTRKGNPQKFFFEFMEFRNVVSFFISTKVKNTLTF